MPRQKIKSVRLSETPTLTAVFPAEGSEAYYALLMENIRDSVISTDTSLVVKSWNKSAEEMYGWTAREALGKKITSLIYAGQAEAEYLALRDEVHAKANVKVELEGFTKSGRRIFIFISASAIYDEQGNYCGMVSVSKDITERKRMEAELLSLNRQLQRELDDKTSELRDIFDRINDGVLLVNSHWECTYASARIADIIQIKTADTVGKSLWEILKGKRKKKTCPITNR